MRTTGIKQDLVLDKIVGARPDKKGLSIVPFKKEYEFPIPQKSINLVSTTKDGFRY